jgi:hypothetical protein
MNPDRTQAYRRVMHTLEQLGPAKLQPDEQDRVRFAADTLIFTGAGETGAREAIGDIRDLMRTLVDSGRWEQATADALVTDLRACGPQPRAAREAA